MGSKKKSIDLSSAFSFAFNKNDWLTDFLIHGLIAMVPLLGPIIILGWQRRIFTAIQKGENQLPKTDLGENLQQGVTPFVASLNAHVPLFITVMLLQVGFLAGFGCFILADEIHEPGFAFLGLIIIAITMALYPLLLLPFYLILPEFNRRGFKGEMWPLINFGPTIRALKKEPSAYLVVCVGFFLTGILGGTGIYLCCVGILLSLPWAHAANAHLLAQFDMMLEVGDDSPTEEPEEPAEAIEASLSDMDLDKASADPTPLELDPIPLENDDLSEEVAPSKDTSPKATDQT